MIDQTVGNTRYIVEFQHGPNFDKSHSRTLSRRTDKVLPRGLETVD